MTAIIILNWNGAQDTIECIDSLNKVDEDFFCIIMDNGSTDDSVTRIAAFLSEKSINHGIINRGDPPIREINNHEYIIFKNGSNMGFAKGNNEAIRIIAHLHPDNYLLLNNDTIVEKDFLGQLTAFARKHPKYTVLAPLIFFYYEKERIWNAGGKLFCGQRRYFYNNMKASDIVENSHIESTFITGCAMFFTPDILRSNGGIFTEDFFFGEEDFNFCINMKRKKINMACVLDSVIYHKVNASTKAVKIGKYYIHYLNRFIDVKKSYGWPFFILWSIPNTLYATIVLSRKKYRISEVFRTMIDVNINAWKKDKVSQNDFIQAINER